MVLGLGSYVAAPVILAAWILAIPRLIHEQNVMPGLANRLLGHVVNRVAVSFDESVVYFPRGKAVVTGNPVRPMMWQVRNRKRPADSRFQILVFGGSQGAHHLNVAVLDALPRLGNALEELWLVHQTGHDDYDSVQTMYAEKAYPGAVHAYIQDMATAYAAADLVICRAGATTIAELTATGKPAILVPFPYAANDHQDHNARTLVSAGAAAIIPDRELTGGLLAERIRHYLRHPQEVDDMTTRILALGKPDAAMRVAHLCLELCRL
jgi:UDP-N-acetylglucosamine--N-acetylmuramyl-(pentapeptide) pyrophosphoryl-undecaprenol N-acetylglucosamine transferase